MLTRAWREPSPGRVSRLCRLVPRLGRGRDGVGGYGCGRTRLNRMNWRWLASPSAQIVAVRPVGYACTGGFCWRLRWKKKQKNRPPITAATMITTAYAVG